MYVSPSYCKKTLGKQYFKLFVVKSGKTVTSLKTSFAFTRHLFFNWHLILIFLALFLLILTRELPSYHFKLQSLDTIFKNSFVCKCLSPVLKGCVSFFHISVPMGSMKTLEVSCREFSGYIQKLSKKQILPVFNDPACAA